MRSIIIYYSKSGNTEKVAKRIEQDIGCEILKVEPVKEYGNYVSAVMRAGKEKLLKEKVSYKTALSSLDDYDVVFVGYPVWYWTLPSFLSDFLKQFDFTSKTVIPFATFGATDISVTLKHLEEACKGGEIKYPFNYGVSKKDDYEKWLEDVKAFLGK